MQSTKIFIKDCRVDLNIGLDPPEQQGAQPVLISVTANYTPDSLFPDILEMSRENIIDYGVIHHFITHTLPGLGHIGLLEAAAERIITFCLQDKHIQAVQVRIEKTTIFANAAGAGVEMSRIRSVMPS